MSAFLSSLEFEDRGGYPFLLTQPLHYYSSCLGLEIVVPRAFSTDLASIPWLVQPLLPRIGRWDRAAVVHDWLYDGRNRTRWRSRALCDAILREAMRVDGVGWQRRAIWLGVRIGGWWAWRQDGLKHRPD